SKGKAAGYVCNAAAPFQKRVFAFDPSPVITQNGEVERSFRVRMDVSSRLNRRLLYQDVVCALYQSSDEQNIQPGAQLPSERELIARLGVSRNVLREAFHVMEQRGIIISQQGRGRFLRSLPRNNVQQDK